MNLLSNLKSKIPELMKVKIRLLFITKKASEWLKFNDDKQKVYIFLAGLYQNLGDMAITYSQKHFLQDCFPDADIVLVPSTSTYYAIKTIKTYIKPEDVITIIGGGNMSDMYASLENARLHVVKSFPNNRIISFPQTMEYTDTPIGRKQFEISRKVYSSHKKLIIFAREPYSLSRMKEAFPEVTIGFCPDIVLSQNQIEPRCERRGVLCCLRSDKEQQIPSKKRDLLIQTANKRFKDVMVRDTIDVNAEACTEEVYEQTLEEFLDVIRHKEVVFTDRLHCMLFCVITGTPCVVLDNTNHKISGVYQAWVKDVEYIRFLTEVDEAAIFRVIEELQEIKLHQLKDFAKEFKALHEACLS